MIGPEEIKPFLDELHRLGYVQGRNLSIDYLDAGGDGDRLPGLAAQLVGRSPEVIFSYSGELAPIVKGAAHDLLPLRTQFQDARRQAVDLLSRERVDRAALEALRADQLRLAEQASIRFTQALADVADVLTPAQRQQLAERIGRWHGRRG